MVSNIYLTNSYWSYRLEVSFSKLKRLWVCYNKTYYFLIIYIYIYVRLDNFEWHIEQSKVELKKYTFIFLEKWNIEK